MDHDTNLYTYINKQLPHVNIYTEWTMIPIHKQTVTSCQYIYRMDQYPYINKQLPRVNIYTEWTMIPIHKQTVTSCQYIYNGP